MTENDPMMNLKVLSYVISLWVRTEIEQNASIVAASNSFLQIPNTVLEIAALILFVLAVTNTIRFIKALKNKQE